MGVRVHNAVMCDRRNSFDFYTTLEFSELCFSERPLKHLQSVLNKVSSLSGFIAFQLSGTRNSNMLGCGGIMLRYHIQ